MTTRKQYTKEFKLDAISLVLEQGYKQAEAARSLDINVNMLSRWIKEHQHDEGQAFRGNGKLTPEQEEIRQLDLVVIPRKPLKVCHLVTPLKPMDALAHGKPLLLSDVEALKEWADLSGGARVFPAGDSKALAKEAHTLLVDNHLRTALSEKGRKWFLENTWDKSIAPLVSAMVADTECHRPSGSG